MGCTGLLSVGTLALLATIYSAVVQIPALLSPQGCRMSYMAPSYILQPHFNATWTGLARRYSLWLYREEGWESPEQLSGVPVLFIPGNAGSSRQVRSIASSAARQFYAEPQRVHAEYAGGKPLDFFAVEFNEDLSALHGPTLLAERSYTAAAVKYILSRYPPHTQILIMGHSMGGIVAVSLLPSPDISAVITMSTPHALPPARLDRGVERMYGENAVALRNASTPVLSICGGATDLMIPSETCAMPRSRGWRKTVYTSGIEGTWSGVGHREMVWCHQVRSRLARAALHLATAPDNSARAAILDRWFRDHPAPLPPTTAPPFDDLAVTYVPAGHRLSLRTVPRQPSLFLLPLPPTPARFILYVSRASLAALSPHHPSDLHVDVYTCPSSRENCHSLLPLTLTLIPNPPFHTPFPLPAEGVDESDGVVRFEAVLLSPVPPEKQWVAVALRGRGDQGSWLMGGIAPEHAVQSHVSQFALLWHKLTIPLDPAALTATLRLPNVLSNALLVYRIETPHFVGSCPGALLPPLVLHRSSPAESHFHPTDPLRPLRLHSHASGPFIASVPAHNPGLSLDIYSSGECGISRLELSLDWWSSLATWGLRYWSTLSAWAVAVVVILMAQAWHTWENGALFPSVSESLARHVHRSMAPLALLLLLGSCLPLGPSYLLGNAGQPILSPLAPLLLVLSTGCVAISWGFLLITMRALSRLVSLFPRLPIAEDARARRRSLSSLAFILLLVLTVVPSQVAFLVCFLIHLFTCATQSTDGHAQKTHILLLLFWLLPLVAPVLAVWVRTLATAGITTPFDGDHDVFAVAGFLLLVDFMSSSPGPVFERSSSAVQRRLTTLVLYSLAVIPLAVGGRYTYAVYTTSNVLVTFLVVVRVGARLWR